MSSGARVQMTMSSRFYLVIIFNLKNTFYLARVYEASSQVARMQHNDVTPTVTRNRGADRMPGCPGRQADLG